MRDLPGVGEGLGDPDRRRTLLTFEALRGVAALLVVIRHGPDVFGTGFASLHLAVDMFFLLSGFVIAYAYEPRLAAGMGAWAFFRLRLVRLYPLYVLALGVAALNVVLAQRWLGDGSWSDPGLALTPLLNFLFLPAPGRDGEMFALNLPAWSLFFELAANLAFVLTWRWLSTRVLIGVVAVAAVALIAAERAYGSLGIGWNWATFAGGFPRVVFGFALGVLLYRVWGAGRRLPVSPLVPIALLVGALMLGGGARQGLYEVGVVLLVMPAVLLLGASSEPSPRLAPAFAVLGATSYGVYVLHAPLLEVARRLDALLPGPAIGDLAPWAGVAFLAGLVAVVWVLDRLYDTPVRRRLAQWPPRAPAARPRRAEAPANVAARAD